VKKIKYLGIYFDRRLTFPNHIEHIAEKSRTLIYMLNKTAKLHWGLVHKTLKILYEGAIVPIMIYEAPVGRRPSQNNNACVRCKVSTGS